MNTKTLKELYTLNDNNELDYGIEYNDGSELNDTFVEVEIVSPHNDQKLQYARVPASMEQQLKDEKKLTTTSKYHDWTSEFTDFLNKIADMDTEMYSKEEAIEEWNETEIGSRYQLTIEDIEEAQFGGYVCTRTFDPFID